MRGRSTCCCSLAREQKVDLTQDLDPGARRPVSRLHRGGARLRLEIAADYLVMAAWLAYLKSRLLLPEPPKARRARAATSWPRRWPTVCDCSRRCSSAGAALMARPHARPRRLRRAARPKASAALTVPVYEAEPLRAARAPMASSSRRKDTPACCIIAPPALYSMDEALQRLRRLVGHVPEWRELVSFLPTELARRRLFAARRSPRLSPRPSSWRAPAQHRIAPGQHLRSDLSAQPARTTTHDRRSQAMRSRRNHAWNQTDAAPRRAAAARGAAVRGAARRADRSRAARLPGGAMSRRCCASLPRLRRARRQPGARRRRLGLPHRARSRAARSSSSADGHAQAVARRGRDAGDHRLSPAGDPRRNRGDPRRRARPAARSTC